MKRMIVASTLVFDILIFASAQAETLCVGNDNAAHVQRVSVVAAATLGACAGCIAPESHEVDEACTRPAHATQVCAAGVIERVSDALIRDLTNEARRERLEAMSACLHEAQDQLVKGAAPDRMIAHWQTRKRIALTVSEHLLDEVEAQAEPMTDGKLKARLDSWLQSHLPVHREDLGFTPLGDLREDICPPMSSFPEGWARLNEKERVDCTLKAIAAAQADLTDTGGHLRDGAGTITGLRSCVSQDGKINPGCCLAKVPSAPAFYDFPRGGKTFRTTMGQFCNAAEAAGLLPPERLSDDAPVPNLAAILDPDAGLIPDEIHALGEFLADEVARHAAWQAARQTGKTRNQDLAEQSRRKFQELMDSPLRVYIENPTAGEFMLGGYANTLVLPIYEKMLDVGRCYPAPAPCDENGEAE